MRLLVTILSLWMSLTTLHAANVVTVSGAEGSPDEKPTITVSLKTDAADAVAAEIRVPLPEGVEPVSGSLKLNSVRVPDHSVTADMNGRDYVIVLFNTSLKKIPAGDSELLTFKVALGDNPGHFDLTPKVKLSGSSDSQIASEAAGGTLTVLAPRLELGSSGIDFGRVPLRSEVVRTVTIRNTGTTTLNLTGFTTGVEGLTAMMPQSLAEGESGQLELHYSPTVRNPGIYERFAPVSNGVGRAPFMTIQSVPFSVNELHIGSASGICDEEVTVSVNMNNMEPIVGADFTIRLPEELDFVEGSVTKGSRASALSVESTMGADRNLRIVMFGLNNSAVTGDDGELLSFRLKLKGRSGSYTLTPSNTVLANITSENMTSKVYGGKVQISAPRLSAASEWKIGNVSLSGTNKFDFPVRNNSNVPLTIEKIVFLDDIVECNTPMPLVVEPYADGEISVSAKDPKFGSFATTMNIYCNDPDNRMKDVAVSGNFYSPNEMSFAGRFADGEYLIDASLTNEEAIAALQLDVVLPAGISTDESLLKLSERTAGHSATLAKVEDNGYRIVIFSLKNTPFKGNEGIIFSLGLDGTAPAGKQVRIENIKLSSTDGVNITTPNTEVQLGSLPVPVTSIALSQSKGTMRVGGELQLSAVVSPTTASVKELKWSSSDTNIVNVDSNGKVTAIALGTAIISAAATDGSGVRADCEITVEKTPVETIILSQEEASLKVGESVTLTATVLPEDATDKTVTWTSSDETVAKVDTDGVVTAIAPGEAIITAKCGEASAICEVTVTPILVESIIISPETWSGGLGDFIQLEVTVLPENATDTSLTWSSDDEAVATVDSNGLVCIQSVGSCVIKATANDGSGVEAYCKVSFLTDINEIFINDNATVDVYTLGGILQKKGCDKTHLKQLLHGSYLLRQGQRVVKLIVK